MGKGRGRKDERRIPRDQRSPYGPATSRKEYLQRIMKEYGVDMGGEKMGPMKCEQAIDAVQGCGVPGCSICMPASGGVRGGQVSGVDDARADAVNNFRKMNNRLIFGSSRGLSLEDLLPPSTRNPKQALIDAERRAREDVKDYILDTTLHVSWEDIAGNEEAHRAMIEAIEFPIKHAKLYKFYGKKPTKGILLMGPPGCGKTMFGKAAAGVMSKLYGGKATMLAINATELQSPYVGQTEKKISQIFAYAKAYKALHGHQLIVFMDEADAILPNRNGGGMGRSVAGWEESNVATFLTEMDGLEDSGALIILATNRPEAIDGALLREGRIDRKIVVKRPDEAAARVILTRAMRNAPTNVVMVNPNYRGLDEGGMITVVDVGVRELFDTQRHLMTVKSTKGKDYLRLSDVVSGAMIVGLVERAKASAFHRDIAQGTMTGITVDDMYAAVEQVMAEQLERPDFYALTELAKRINAPVLELDRVQKPEIKWGGTLN